MPSLTLDRRRSLLAAAARWLSRLRLALERQETRRALARLNDAQLADIGRTREEAAAESAKPFWR